MSANTAEANVLYGAWIRDQRYVKKSKKEGRKCKGMDFPCPGGDVLFVDKYRSRTWWEHIIRFMRIQKIYIFWKRLTNPEIYKVTLNMSYLKTRQKNDRHQEFREQTYKNGKLIKERDYVE